MIEQSDGFANVNGGVCQSQSASVAIWNGGVQFGYGLFETLRTYGSVFFAWSEHYERMVLGCDALHMKVPFSESQGLEQLEELQSRYFEQEGKADAVFRVTVMPSSIENWNLGQTIYIITRRPAPALEKQQTQGITIAVLKTLRSPSVTENRIKGISFTDVVLARQELYSYRSPSGDVCEEGLMLDASGKIIEATCSNVFLVFRDSATGIPMLITPPESDGPLLGITRKYVLQIAEQLNLFVIERSVFVSDIMRAQEIFLTSSVREVIPVAAVLQNGQSIYTARGKHSSITQQILKKYQQLIILKNRK